MNILTFLLISSLILTGFYSCIEPHMFINGCYLHSGATCTEADLSSSKIENINLSNSDLTGTKFRYSTFKNITLDNAILDKTDFTYATIENSDFSVAKSCLNITWTNGKIWSDGKMAGGPCYNKQEQEQKQKQEQNNCDLKPNAKCQGGQFIFDNILKLDLRNSDFRNSIFWYSNLSELDLRNSNLVNTSFSFATLNKVNFSQANLTSSEFIDSKLNELNITDTILDKTNFIGATIESSDFSVAKSCLNIIWADGIIWSDGKMAGGPCSNKTPPPQGQKEGCPIEENISTCQEIFVDCALNDKKCARGKWKELSISCHPDKGGTHNVGAHLNCCYDKLIHPDKNKLCVWKGPRKVTNE